MRVATAAMWFCAERLKAPRVTLGAVLGTACLTAAGAGLEGHEPRATARVIVSVADAVYGPELVPALPLLGAQLDEVVTGAPLRIVLRARPPTCTARPSRASSRGAATTESA